MVCYHDRLRSDGIDAKVATVTVRHMKNARTRIAHACAGLCAARSRAKPKARFFADVCLWMWLPCQWREEPYLLLGQRRALPPAGPARGRAADHQNAPLHRSMLEGHMCV